MGCTSDCNKSSISEKLIKDRILFLTEEIDGSVATNLVATLLYLDLQDSEKEITIYINSVGGSISDGLHTIYDTIQYIKSPVKTICMGEAFSSAAVILAAGTKGKRFAYNNAKIMIHSVQLEDFSGSYKEMQEEMKRIKSLNQSLIKIIASHTGQNLKKIQKDCEKDKYFTAEEAIKYGLIDDIIPFSKIVS